jgi:hypothetical protein
MKNLLCTAFIAMLLLSSGCARRHNVTTTAGTTSSNSAPAKSTREGEELENDRPMGTATMQEDGTIILNLRAEGSGGTVGEARMVYRKGDKRYSEVLKHLGGLEPGQSKTVPPWPDEP